MALCLEGPVSKRKATMLLRGTASAEISSHRTTGPLPLQTTHRDIYH